MSRSVALNELVSALGLALHAGLISGERTGEIAIGDPDSPGGHGTVAWRRGRATYQVDAPGGPPWIAGEGYRVAGKRIMFRGSSAWVARPEEGIGRPRIEFLVSPYDWRGKLAGILAEPLFALQPFGADGHVYFVGHDAWADFWTPSIFHFARGLSVAAATPIDHVIEPFDQESPIAIRALPGGRTSVLIDTRLGDKEIVLDRVDFVGLVAQLAADVTAWTAGRGVDVAAVPNLEWLRRATAISPD